MSYENENRDGPPPLSDRDAYDDRYGDSRAPQRAPGLPPHQAPGCSKGCFYGLAGCGCLTFVLVIAMGVGLWKLGTWYNQVDSTIPADIQRTAQEIADFTPPKDMKPQLRRVLTVTRVVAYRSNDDAVLVLEQVDHNPALKGPNFWVDFDEGFKTELEGDGRGPNILPLDLEKSEQRDIPIRGKPAKLTFADAKDSSGAEYKQITGSFEGKRGPVSLTYQIPAENYKDEDVVKFLKEIK